jgi:iron complex transport system substrate-binding protein
MARFRARRATGWIQAAWWLALLNVFAGLPVYGEPQRIVSTAPSITELLYALGLGDRVAGVTRFCRYPPEAQKKPKIGDYVNPNLEAIAALKPDLVIIQTNPARLAERLGALHLRVLEINQENISALFQSIRIVGNATGRSAAAEKLAALIRSQLDGIHQRVAALPPVRMMFVVSRSPNRLDGLVVVGKASYLNEVIQLAGGENVFRDAVASYPEVSLEEVIARNPEVVIDTGDMGDPGEKQHARQVIALWQRARAVAAVRNNRVFPVTADFYTIPGPRVVNAAQQILDMLHPTVLDPKTSHTGIP